MMGNLGAALTHRLTGPVAASIALALAVLMAASWSAWNAERAALERRIAELSRQSERSQSLWRAQLAACHAAAAPEPLTETAYEAPAGTSAQARRLLSQQPEGIDVCARMESADQAVLATLK